VFYSNESSNGKANNACNACNACNANAFGFLSGYASYQGPCFPILPVNPNEVTRVTSITSITLTDSDGRTDMVGIRGDVDFIERSEPLSLFVTFFLLFLMLCSRPRQFFQICSFERDPYLLPLSQREHARCSFCCKS
jgi:hypothetical protein